MHMADLPAFAEYGISLATAPVKVHCVSCFHASLIAGVHVFAQVYQGQTGIVMHTPFRAVSNFRSQRLPDQTLRSARN
eukprot:COSAG01_NODE_11671_length_1883_cov_4.470852_2_plen_78_part_00